MFKIINAFKSIPNSMKRIIVSLVSSNRLNINLAQVLIFIWF